MGLVWMAAHMHEQLKRSQVRVRHECQATCTWTGMVSLLSYLMVQVSGMSLIVAADALLHPETPLALRLSGQLLLGLVRLYSKQLGYLHQVSTLA